MHSGKEDETVTKEDILANAHEIFKDYFTAPPSKMLYECSSNKKFDFKETLYVAIPYT